MVIGGLIVKVCTADGTVQYVQGVFCNPFRFLSWRRFGHDGTVEAFVMVHRGRCDGG